jgi:D-alanyl-D-alanine carboxypeptidase
MTRRCAHLLILALLASLPLLSGFGRTSSTRVLVAAGGGGPLEAAEIQPPAVPPVEGQSSESAGQLPAQDAAQAQRLPPTVRAAPTWLQAFQATELWSSDGADAASQLTLPQWTPVRLLGEQVNGRLPVEYPGDGESKLPQRGWVQAADVGATGRPNPELELNAGGYVSPATGVPVPRRSSAVWPRGISATFAVVVDGASGEILWGRNARGRVAPASLTKIVTSLVALERARLTDRVAVRFDTSRMWESTTMGLTPGETVSMETLLFGLMLPSGNDAALAIANHVAGSEPAFAELMNAKARELGLSDSHFVNPHGLDADNHYSSPFDLCMLARAGMRDPTFYRLASTRKYEAEGYTLYNLNKLLGLYPPADGVKVGYTDNAGRAIVGSATQNGRRVYVALIRSQNPAPEAQALLEWAFKGYTWQ